MHTVIIQVTGDRNWKNRRRIRETLEQVERECIAEFGPVRFVLRHGKAKGADTMFGATALDMGWTVEEFPADWARYGRAAGPIRNQAMLDAEPTADMLLWAHDDIENSKGTANMLKQWNDRHSGRDLQVD